MSKQFGVCRVPHVSILRRGTRFRFLRVLHPSLILRRVGYYRLAAFAAVLATGSIVVAAQTTAPKSEPELVREAQTVSIPLTAIARDTVLPVKNLTASDLQVDVDGKSVPFQLSRPGERSPSSKRAPATSPVNLLIILPLAAPSGRNDALNEAITDLSRERESGWNISILNASGAQTAYTRSLKTAVAELKQVQNESPSEVDLHDWRVTAALAITGMRKLPGRRVVLSLGDIFHEVVFEGGQLVMNNFQIADISAAARLAGAILYAADSTDEVESLRRLSPNYSLLGSGPWLLLAQSGQIAGWITGSVANTLAAIRRNAAGDYQVNLHLSPEQMDGKPHPVSILPRRPDLILDAPPQYIAPNLARLRALDKVSPGLRTALENPSQASSSSPLLLTTQLSYFPHPDHKTGTQIATTGFFWTGSGPHPANLGTALELKMPITGLILQTTIGGLRWTMPEPVWNVSMDVVPGIYQLNVAAADPKGSISAGTTQSFTVSSSADEAVLISSVVLGKHCVFSAPVAAGAATQPVDYLQAGDCHLQPDPSRYYTPRDVVWTLVRITPTGKVANRPAKDWKGEFSIVDADGHRIAKESVDWLTAADGSFVASAAFPLSNPKLKLSDGEYDVEFQLKGPEIERNFREDATFTVYGAAPSEEKH